MMYNNKEQAINEKWHPAHSSYRWMQACIFAKVAGLQGAEHIGTQVGHKYGSGSMHAGGTHKYIYGNAHSKTQNK